MQTPLSVFFMSLRRRSFFPHDMVSSFSAMSLLMELRNDALMKGIASSVEIPSTEKE